MASLMPTLLDFDDFSRFDFNPILFPSPLMDPSLRCGASTSSVIQNPFMQQQYQPQQLDLNANIPFDTPLDNPPTAVAQDIAPLAPRYDFTPAAAEQPVTTVGFGNLTQQYIAQHYGIPPVVPRPTLATVVSESAVYRPSFTEASSFALPLASTSVEPSSDPTGSSFLTLGTSASEGTVSTSSTAVGNSATSGQKRRSTSAISKDKLEERRRKNRESSSRCYYNRKRQIEQIERTLTEQKRRAITLYAQELELRNENARLKKELVLRNIRIPSSMLTTTRAEPFSRPPVAHLHPC